MLPRLLLILSILALPNLLVGWAKKGFFARFPNYYFVETGTLDGQGLQNAREYRTFQEYHTIELSEYFYNMTKAAFEDQPDVHLWLGDSGKTLSEVIQTLNKPITFWLDAHGSGGLTARAETNSVIMQELEAIKKHPIKTHTILIDDIRLCGTDEFDYVTLVAIMDKIKEINPNYEFKKYDGAFPEDILVATIGVKKP
jgi:hypothetical protein